MTPASSSRTVLVTGATGFIGRAVCRLFAAAGWRVRGAARRGPTLEDVELRTLDLEHDDLGALVEANEVIVHLAGRAHVLREREADPRGAYARANADMTARLAQAAAQAGVRRFVYVSTAKVFGERSGARPFSESDAPHPQDDYARSKLEGELRLRECAIASVVVRPPLVFGPHVGANFVRLLQLVERGVPLPLASLTNRRSLVFVENLADCLLACATHPHAAGRTFLPSDGVLSTPQLVRLMAESLGRRARLVPCPPQVLLAAGWFLGRRDDVRRLVHSLELDDSGVRTVLGWRAPCALGEGMRKTLDWYRGR